jgi:hypothetical protein
VGDNEGIRFDITFRKNSRISLEGLLTSWIEFDKTLTKLFESFYQKITKDREPEEADDLSSASSCSVHWLDNHVLECRMEEEFPKMRLICVKCGEKITDEQFIVISHPEFPEDYSKSFYFHSKGRCTPRWERIQEIRERWLQRHDQSFQEREEKKKE